MASITGKKAIFFVTSPRSPLKMVDEVRFLVENFSGQKWNSETQNNFYEGLVIQPFFDGGQSADPAFSARDRITRGPKSLGLVELKPNIALSKAGNAFLYGNRIDEAILRQMLKFQFPSPFHTDKNGAFSVKPYLELMRFVRDLGGLTKTEIALFVMQLTNYSDYERLKMKIEVFRNAAKHNRKVAKINYREFVKEQFIRELSQLFSEEIEADETAMGVTDETTIKDFLKKKRSNHLDYADAAIRYLRATNLFTFNARSLRVSVMPERASDVDFILEKIPREPRSFDSEKQYGTYLFAAETPILLTDNAPRLIKNILAQGSLHTIQTLKNKGIEKLKDIFTDVLNENLKQIISQQRDELRKYGDYEDIEKTFDLIRDADIADPSLYLEWNVWRAFEMLDDGLIEGHFRVDNNGAPLYTAPGNMADIVCKYSEFETIVEVTRSTGQRQYEMEGEPVSRHYGQHRTTTTKPVFAIFIATQINKATLAHYFVTSRTNVAYYGGPTKIIPLSLNDFRKLLENAKNASRKPDSKILKALLDELSELALTSTDEEEWAQAISNRVITAFK